MIHPVITRVLKSCSLAILSRRSKHLFFSIVTDILKTIPVEDFQRCYQKREQLHWCVASQGNYFKGDNIDVWKKLKLWEIKKTVSLLFWHTLYNKKLFPFLYNGTNHNSWCFQTLPGSYPRHKLHCKTCPIHISSLFFTTHVTSPHIPTELMPSALLAA